MGIMKTTDFHWHMICSRHAIVVEDARIYILKKLYSRLPAFLDDICNGRIHIIRNFKPPMLEPNSSNNLHWVHSSPRLLQSRQLPQYDPKAINIAPACESRTHFFSFGTT